MNRNATLGYNHHANLVTDTLTAAYAAEICPIKLRGLAASFISMAWGFGGFLSSGMARAALSIDGDWSWRMPYVLQFVWPVPLFIVAWFAPESKCQVIGTGTWLADTVHMDTHMDASNLFLVAECFASGVIGADWRTGPYWLVRKGRLEDAKDSLKRTASKGYYDTRSLDGYIAYIKHTDDLERAEASTGSVWEMFKGTNLRRTEIMMGGFLQQPVQSAGACMQQKMAADIIQACGQCRCGRELA